MLKVSTSMPKQKDVGPTEKFAQKVKILQPVAVNFSRWCPIPQASCQLLLVR